MKTYIFVLEDNNKLYDDICIKVLAEDVQLALNKFKNINIDELLKWINFVDNAHDFDFKSLYDLDSMCTIK